MTNTSNTFFVCSIISIFCILLATVPISDDSLGIREIGRDEGNEYKEEIIIDPISLAQKNKTSFYNYLKTLENANDIGPEYRTVEFWMEARNSQIE